MAGAKFSLNFNSMTIGSSVQTAGIPSIYDAGTAIGGIGGSDVSLPTATRDGIFIEDNEAQQCVLRFTAFQAFPVEYSGSYTMCLDGAANHDTQIGSISSGARSFPGSFKDESLNAITEKQFKMGCAINFEQRNGIFEKILSRY